jgi:hypothetical protein
VKRFAWVVLLSALSAGFAVRAARQPGPSADREVILPARSPAPPRRLLRGGVLAVSAVPRLEPAPALEDFLAARELARAAGARGDFVSRRWSELEPSPRSYEDALAYVHLRAPRIRVGVTSTFGGASGSFPAEVERLNEQSDVFLLTYYPLGPGFLVQPPSSPLVDFPRMVSLAGNRPVILQEMGYPSSPLLGSSETMQVEFVTSVFTA